MEVAQEMKNRTNNVTHTMSAKDVLPVMFIVWSPAYIQSYFT